MGVVVRSDASKTSGYSVDGLLTRKDRDKAVAASEVEDPQLLAQILTEMRSENANVRRDASGRWIEYEDVAVGSGGADVTLPHGFNGRVRHLVTDVVDNGGTAPILMRDTANTTADSLVLKSYAVATVTIRIEKVTS